ncbi:ABC transporter ATP-binding protein [Gluconacetobacter azotocaptans]|uniref:ABC transporter ATP-binding protein n=2 Tax=Gluconacetobacter azotocaptans TaxID=142834 RepID=A0A7W4PEN3_9PROT|nr:ABC transporter ATP-binding protein [Gluconacetobacter azotocaptans]
MAVGTGRDIMADRQTAPGAQGRARNEFGEVLGFVIRRWLRHPASLACTLAGVAVATVADVVTPLLAGWLVDDVARAGAVTGPVAPALVAARHDVLLLLGGLGVLGLLGVAGRRMSYLGITFLTARVMRDIAQTAFARVQRFSTDWHGNTFAGSTVRRLTRGMWAVDTLADTLMLMLLPGILVLGATTVVLALRWPLMGTLLGASSVGLVLMSTLLTLRYVAPSARLANAWDTRMGAALADAVTCNAVVKAFGAEQREEARLSWILSRWQKRTERSWVRGTNSGNLQNLAALAMRVLLVGAVLALWWRGRAGPGDVAYVLTMVFLVQGYLRDIGQQISMVQRSVNEMEELVAIYRLPMGVADAAGASPLRVTHGVIRFDHVSFGYRAQQGPLFRDLSIDIPAGSRVALVGPSGSGKTTLVKLLQRLYDVSDGRILIDGTDIATITQSSLRSQIAIVQQEPVLFHRSLAENISYGRPDATLAEIQEAARQANAAGFIDRLPKGYATMVGERGVKLSGGERQRVAIARAFLANAPILIFDEATSSLDSESEILVQEAMERLMVGRTVLVIAHRLSTVVGLDRILVFARGELREDGSHAELIAQDGGLYRRLFELQSLDG